eukprot:3184293-Amphidinium_carterae.1
MYMEAQHFNRLGCVANKIIGDAARGPHNVACDSFALRGALEWVLSRLREVEPRQIRLEPLGQ